MSSVSSVSLPSEVSSVSFSSDDEFENDIHIPRAPRVFRERLNRMDIYGDDEFKSRYRLPKKIVNLILEIISDRIEPATFRNQSIPALMQLLMTLRYYACGSFQLIVGDHFNVTKSTAGRIIHKVTHVIASLREEYIKMPNLEQQNDTALKFFNITGFPNVCGTIDCTHIKIQSPGGTDAENFRNRKGYFSLNVQVISNAALQVMDVVARWPGSTHDSHIFDRSLIRARLENNEFPNKYLLGDSEYPCRNYILTPLLNPDTPAERRYSQAHINSRNVMKRTFGVLKGRFPCLTLGLRVPVNKVIPIIVACCILHNIAINENDDFEFNEDEENEEQEIIVDQHFDNNYSVRNELINTIFR